MAQAPSATKMIKLNVNDRNMLYRSYMSYLKNGGFFVVTNDSFSIGEEVMFLLTIMEHENPFPLRCKVVWINPKSNNPLKPSGIGLSFFPNDEIAQMAKNVIETNLAGVLDSQIATFTM
ncbi:MAG: PilZ domain-containing protein [Neisseriaceae bacterium]|nr:PilZ domain-containing protein [Neisseriaceae bacterium]